MMSSGIDISGAILAFGIVFWLAGGAGWVSEKTRQLRLDNNRKDQELQDAARIAAPTNHASAE